MSDLATPCRPRQNRMTPLGELEVTTAKGLFLGNRGDLLNRKGHLVRRFKQKFWITCTLNEIFGRKVPLDRPGYYTPLFFLDEATAFAAGHRPCAMCRKKDYLRFRKSFVEAGFGYLDRMPSAPEIDECLHQSRIAPDGTKATYQANLRDLPDGVFFTSSDDPSPRLKWKQNTWRWTHFGYVDPCSITNDLDVTVLTPKPLVLILVTGYEPMVHTSVDL